MKILHTSDWHLGHTLYRYDRSDEHAAMLLKMVKIVEAERPDAFVLCGDVYHTSQPSAAVQTMFANALVEIHNAHPEMSIVITAGNHDSGTKHDIFRTPWKALNVHTVGGVDAKAKEDLIVEIPGKGYVIAVPYVYERNMPEGLFQELLDMVAERNADNLPVVMTAHTTVSGCDFSGHENASEYTVGGIDAYSLEEMGTGYDYLALGHIHHGQTVHGSDGRVRYSGSVVPVSFDESYTHSVSIVEINAHGDKPAMREIEIEPIRPLVTLPAKDTATLDEAMQLLRDFPDNADAYVRLNVHVDDALPAEAHTEALMAVKYKRCRFCLICTHRTGNAVREAKVMTVEEFKAEAPIDIARIYAEDMGVTFDEDLKELFEETLRQIGEDIRDEKH